jgi:hypothetical protein
VRQVDRLQAELFRQRVAQGRLGHETELHQQPADRQVRFHLLEQRDPQLVLGEDALVDQNLADMPLGLGIRGRIHPASIIPVAPTSRLVTPGFRTANICQRESCCTRVRAVSMSKLATRFCASLSARW